MKSHLTTWLAWIAMSIMPAASWSDSRIDSESARCASIVVGKPVWFDGRTLEEIPDIREPALRLANLLLSSDCRERADEVFRGFLRANPDNVHSTYYMARSGWMAGSPDVAREILDGTLARHPGFASARVLLAGLELAEENHVAARRLLDEAERISPNDVWIYVNRARLATLAAAPPPDLKTRMKEMAMNPAFPPNVRVAAADIGSRQRLESGEYEEFLRIKAGVRTSFTACDVANLATNMLYLDIRRFSEVRKLLESPEARAGNCLGVRTNRLLLAQAYLLEAAAIDPQPSAANAAWISLADSVLHEGEYVELANEVAGRPQAEQLRPFLRTKALPEATDGYGVSSLCRALDALDASLVQSYLDEGADPGSSCHGMPLIARLTYFANGTRVPEMLAVGQALFNHHADPTPAIEACRNNDNGSYCSRDLLPLLLKNRR